MVRQLPFLILAVILAAFVGYLADGKARTFPGRGQRESFFVTPESAVGQISSLMLAQDWKMLASYYDFEGTGLTPDDLIPDNVSQADARDSRARLSAPFPPHAEFVAATPLGDGDTDLVVKYEDAEGNRAYAHLRLRPHPFGWQLVPARRNISARPEGTE